MNRKIYAYIATSLDGFIAGNDGSHDWLNEAYAKVPDWLSGFHCIF